METIVKENLVKNIVLIVLFALIFNPIGDYLVNTDLVTDKPLAGDVLVAVSLVAVIGCFGCFTFTYEKINRKKAFERYLAHFSTGLYLLVIGMSLIFTKVLLSFLMGSFYMIDLMLVLLYVACIGFDFWDLFRVLD